MNTSECYICISGDWVPARVIRETKSTIVATLASRLDDAYPIAFNKRKVYGESRYFDPRLENCGDAINPLSERGNSRFYGKVLTFECAKVLKRIEESRRDKLDTSLTDLHNRILEARANLSVDVPAPVFTALDAVLDTIATAKTL